MAVDSEVTEETVIAVRHPELDADTPTHVTFRNYLADRQARVGGFMLVFAVFHNRNDMSGAQTALIGWLTQRVG